MTRKSPQKFFGKNMRYVPRVKVTDKRGGVSGDDVAAQPNVTSGEPGNRSTGEATPSAPPTPLVRQAPPHPFHAGEELPLKGVWWTVMETKPNGAMVLFPTGLTAATKRKLEKKGKA